MIVGRAFYFLANTGWGAYGQDGKKKAGAGEVRSEVRKLGLR